MMRHLGPVAGAELARASLPAICAPNLLVIRFATAYNHLYLAYQASQKLLRLQEAVRRVAGESWSVRCELSADGGTPATESDDQRQPPESNPAIDAATKALAATILKVDEGFGQMARSPRAVEPDEEGEAEES